MPPQTQDTTVGFSPLINFRKKYPQYNDLDDDAVVSGLAKKYPKAYGDLPEQYTAYKSTFSTDKTIVPDKKDVVENTPPPEVNTQKTEPEVKLSTEPYTPLQTVDAFGTPKTQTETSPNRSNLFGIDPGVMNQSLEKVAPEFVENKRRRDELSNKLNMGVQQGRETVDPLSGQKLGDLKLENAPMGDFRNALNTFVNAGLKMVPGTIEAIGLIGDKIMQRGLSTNLSIEDFVTPPPVISGTTGEIGKGMREGIDSFAKIDPKVKGFFASTLPSAFGSALGFMAGGIVGTYAKVPTLLSTLTLSMSQAAEEYNSALEQTGDPNKAYQTFIGNLPFAATEVVPFERLFSRLNKLGGKRGTQLLMEMFAQGSVEGSQEVIQQFGANLNAKMIYDASRKLSEGTLEGGAAGFFTGMLLAGLGGVAQKKLDNGNLTQAEIKDLTKAIETVSLEKAKVEQTFKEANAHIDKVARDLQNPQKVKNSPKDHYKMTDQQTLVPPTKDMEKSTITVTPEGLNLEALTDLTPEERERNGMPPLEESPEVKQQQIAEIQRQKQITKIDTDNFAELNRQVKNASRKRSLYNIDQLKQNIDLMQSPEMKAKAQGLLDEATKNNEKLQGRNVFSLENLAQRKYGKSNLNELEEDQQQSLLAEYNEMKKQGIAEFKPINTVPSVLKGISYPEAIAPIQPQRKTVADLEREKLTSKEVSENGQEKTQVLEDETGGDKTPPISEDSQVAEEDINLNPTDAQKEAGNYKKAHIKKEGLDISIENPKGSIRSGKDSDGETWETELNNDYGYIKGTVGKDKDHLDVFLASDYQEDAPVFIVNQTTPDGKFDEHKVMLGFTNSEDAEEAYLKNYNEGAAHYNDVIEMPMDRFKKWSKDQSLTKRPAKAEEGFLEKFDKLPAEMQTKIRSEYEAEFEKAENKEALNKKYEEIVDKELQPKKEPATKWKNDLSKAPEGAFAVKLTTGETIYDETATNHTELIENKDIEELDVVESGFISEGKFLTTKEIADKARKEVEAEDNNKSAIKRMLAQGKSMREVAEALNIKFEEVVKVELENARIGVNKYNEPLYEDDKGVRYRLDGNIRISEPVGLIPTKNGIVKSVNRTDDDWLTEKELKEKNKDKEDLITKDVTTGEETKIDAELNDVVANIRKNAYDSKDFNDFFGALTESDKISLVEAKLLKKDKANYNMEDIVFFYNRNKNPKSPEASMEDTKTKVDVKETIERDEKGYPKVIDEWGSEHTIKLWATHLTKSSTDNPNITRLGGTGWEWWGFRKQGDIWDGYVEGFENEFGSFSESELKENNVTIKTDAKDLIELQPPIGWKWKMKKVLAGNAPKTTKAPEPKPKAEKKPESAKDENWVDTSFANVKEGDYVRVFGYDKETNGTAQIAEGKVTFKYGNHYLNLDDSKEKYNFGNGYQVKQGGEAKPEPPSVIDDDMKNIIKDIEKGLEGITFQLKKPIESKNDIGPKSVSKKLESPEFKKWFGNSKVVDENGKPLVVYHGTNKTFSSFKVGRKEGAIFFTDSPSVAEGYSQGFNGKTIRLTPEGLVEKQQLYPVYLSIENPKVIDFKGQQNYNFKKEVEIAKQEGYDGIIINNVVDMGGSQNQYAVFNPSQIKSSIGNQGTYWGGNDNITFQLKPGQKIPSDVQTKANELIGKFVDKGITKFDAVIKTVNQAFGEETLNRIFPALKAGYTAYLTNATDEETEKMDSFDYVKKYTLETKKETSEPGVVPKDAFADIKKPDTGETGVSRPFIQRIREEIRKGNVLNKTQLEKIAKEFGITDPNVAKEQAELAIVAEARKIINETPDEKEAYEKLIELYKNQPNLTHRTNESVEKQQYSTPAPIAYISGLYVADEVKAGDVLEPSAGNGMLTIAFNTGQVYVNEIDPVRNRNLRQSSFQDIKSEDSEKNDNLFNKKFDGIMTNPPFGGTTAKDFDGYPLAKLEHIMAANALKQMQDNGRAGIIIGGHNRYDNKGRLKNDRTFFNWLNHYYNVEAVLNVSGDLYRKQGAAFPIRVILVNGRKAVPQGASPLFNEVIDAEIKTFDELYNRIEEIRNGNILRPAIDGDRGQSGIADVRNPQGKTDQEAGGVKTILETEDSGTNTEKPTKPGQTSNVSVRPSGTGKSVSGKSDTVSGSDTGKSPLPNSPAIEESGKPGGIVEGGSGGNVQQGFDRGSSPVAPRAILDSDKANLSYVPESKGVSLDTVIPRNMAFDTAKTLKKIADSVGGDIDAFVAEKLGYQDKEELFSHLGAEQIDAVAMAIVAIEKGQGMIVGDMTGVGKGRIAASIIRYGNINGYEPIFFSEKADLYSDLYRDLNDIGSKDLNPFIVNEAASIVDEEGNVIHQSPKGKKKTDILQTGNLGGYDFVLCTYSQVNSERRGLKRNFIEGLSQGNILIMDESHNASGDSNTGSYFRKIVQASKGVTYLSATFAKRPDNMPIYALKTAISEANLSEEELVRAIERGGVALQEILSTDMVESGQMIRRERTYEGIKVTYKPLVEKKVEHTKIVDAVTGIVRDIIDFQTQHISGIVDRLDTVASETGETVTIEQGTNMAGVDNTPFASKVFNVVDQLLFSIKADSIADEAIEAFKRGQKPVIAVKNTMESFLDYLGAQPGEVIENTDFSTVLERGLRGVFRIRERDAMGNVTPSEITLNQLSEEGRKAYKALIDKINTTTTGITISPIDHIIYRLNKAGYKIGEVTGRDISLKFRDDGKAIVEKRTEKDKKKLFRDFNNWENPGESRGTEGFTDMALMINASGSTGRSAHSSPKFKDQRQRIMITGQIELNINTEIQKRGRVNRTGQVNKPEYITLASAIPAEQRLMMMAKKKLKSLDANVSSDQSQAGTTFEANDFLNKYGDEIVVGYLKENRDINDLLLDPLKMNGMSEEEYEKFDTKENAAHKVSGRVAILPTVLQAEFYKEMGHRYDDQIAYLESVGENDLEVKTLPLDAVTTSSRMLVAGKGGESPFGRDTMVETAEINVLKKPFRMEKINEMLDLYLEGSTKGDKKKTIQEEFKTFWKDWTETHLNKKKEVVAKALEISIEDVNKHLAGGISSEDIAKKYAQFAKFGPAASLKIDDEFNKYVRESDKLYAQSELVLNNILGRYNIGRVYKVPLIRDAVSPSYSNGIFLGWKINKNRKNPYAPSAIVLRFAVTDSRQVIEVVGSNKDWLNDLTSESASLEAWQEKDILSGWDNSLPDSRREVKQIVTGNILQAMGGDVKGQLVSYTTKDGGLKRGILIRDNKSINTDEVRVPIKRALKFIKNLDFGDFIETASGDVVLSNYNGSNWTIEVPASKQKGGKYYLDEAIRKVVKDGRFDKYGNQMRAVFSKSKLEELVNILQDDFGQSVRLSQDQLKQIEDGDTSYQLKGVKIYQDDFGNNIPANFSKIHEFKLKHPLLKNVEVEFVDPITVYWTREEIESYNYTPELLDLEKLEKGDFGYEEGKEKYPIEITGYNRGNPEQAGSSVTISSRATKSAYTEELIHTIYNGLEKTNPDLLRKINIWEEIVRDEASAYGIDIPQGGETFAQVMTFTHLGYADEAPNVAEAFEIPADILDEFTKMLDSGGVSSDVLKGNSQRGIIRLPSGKIDNSLTNFQNKRTKKGAISQIDPIIIKAQEVYKKLKSEKGETKDVYPEWVREMRTAYGPNFDKQARSIWKRKGEAFLPQYQLKIAQEGKSLIDSEFIERAKKHFGTTDNFKVAAWITTDGSMLDFSDKSSGGQSRVRTKEHEEIGTFEKDKTNYNKYSFNEMGNIRLISLSQNEGMEIAQPPTAAQKEVIRKIINSLDGKINIEIRPDSSFPYYEKFRKGTTAEEIFESISDYFSGRTRRPSFLSEFRQSYQLKKPKKTREQRFHGYKFDSETAREQGREPQNGEGNLVDFGIGLGNVITVTADKINDFVKNSQLEKRYNLENDSKAKKIYRELLTAPQWFFDKEPQLRRIWDIMDRYFVRNINEETAILKEDKWKNSKTWKKLSDLEQKEFLSALEEYEQTQYELQRDEGATELLDWMDFADEYNLTPKVADFLMRTYKPTIETALDMVKDVDRYKIINETETNPYLESYFGSVAKKLAPDQLQLELEKAKDEFFADDPNAQALFENELLRMTKPDEVKAMQLAWANNPNLRATLAEVLIDKKYESIDNKAYFPSSRLERKYFLSGLKKTTAEEKLLQGLFDDKFFTTSDSLSALEKIKIDLEAEGYTVKVGKFAEAQETILMNAVSQEDILDLALSAGVDQDNPTLEKLVKAIQAKGFSRHFIPKRFVPGFEYNKENFEEAIFKYITAVPFYKNRTIGGKEFAKTMSLLKHSGALKPGSANDNYIRDLKNKLENRDVRLSQGLRAIASTYYLALSPAYLSQQIVQPINTLLPYLPIAAKQLGLRSIEAEKAFGESLLTSLQYWGWKVIDKTNRVFGRNTRATFGLDRDFLSIIRSLERQGVGKPLRSMELAGQEVDPRKHYNRDVLEKTMDTLGWIAKIAGLPGIVIEDFTRTIGIRAFYNLGKKAGLTGDALEDFISVSIAKTYGPASGRLAKPPGYYIAGDGRMKIVKEGAQSTIESWLTFKNFAFMNFGQWGKIWRSLRDDNIYRTAGYKLGSQIGLGGLKYIMWSSSILTLMSLVYGMFDVPEDPDEQYKDMFMQLNKLVPGLGDALYKGVASVTFNVDLSSLFSQTAPIEEPFTKDAVELIGGAPVSAIKDIYSGRAPRVLRGSQVAEKWKEEGIKLGSRKLIPPDEITKSDITKRKLGYTPLKVSDAYQEENSRQFKSGQYTDIIREKVTEKIIPLIESGKGDVARDEFRKIWNDMKEDNILTEHQLKSIDGLNSFISQVVLSRLKENERQIVKDWKNGYSNSRSRTRNRENERERENDR